MNFNQDEPVQEALIRSMMDRISHRGPDGSGEYIRGPIGLGHRRLSIIDLSTGDQPMSNEDGSVWVVFNGEIYNFKELRFELEARGHRFKSKSDTEVIVHMYEEVGDACVERFNGMFAFALWDESRRRLLLARDRVGVKPLYYVDTGKAVLFSSEVKAILADPDLVRSLNLSAVDRFLTYYYVPGNETLLKHVNKLRPGHYLTVEHGRVATRRYWDLSFCAPSPQMRYPDAVNALRELLRDAIRDHMISDVPVGVLLSGGVDSTGVLRYAVDASEMPIHTFTVGFSGARFDDERPYARLVAKQFGTEHHEMSLQIDEFRDFLPSYVWHMEEPVCEPPAIALFFVSRLARQNSVKVLLSGEGGDEAFGGYPEYRNFLLFERLKAFFGTASEILQYGLEGLVRLGFQRFERYAYLVNYPISEYYLSRTATPATCFNRFKRDLYKGEFADALWGELSNSPTHELFQRARKDTVLNQMLYVDTNSWLPDDLLTKADKMTMATSVELRVPLLDFRVLEFAASLPEEYKVHGWKMKRILRSALAESIPPEVLNRKKAGFPVPYDEWLRNEMRDFVQDTILAPNAGVLGFLSREAVRTLVDKHQQGAGCAKEIFSLVVLELWLQQFARRPAEKSLA